MTQHQLCKVKMGYLLSFVMVMHLNMLYFLLIRPYETSLW